MLEVRNLVKNFGGIHAVKNVSFSFEKGEFLGLIGPNGSGKTTIFNLISGVYKPTSGNIMFNGKNISGLSPDEICHRGIARTFQIPKPILDLSVLDNVMLGILFGKKGGSFHRKAKEEAKEEAVNLLNFIGLKVDEDTMPVKLTAAELRKLEIARTLGTKPELLLADEVLSGLNHEELSVAGECLRKIHDEMGITIIWVEHIMGVLMGLVDRVIVLNYGELIADGSPEEVSNASTVVEAYLGED